MIRSVELVIMNPSRGGVLNRLNINIHGQSLVIIAFVLEI